jgi:hypothetical protein
MTKFSSPEQLEANKKKELLGIRDFAEIVDMHEYTVRQYVLRGILPSVKTSRNYKIKVQEALTLVMSGGLEGEAATPYDPELVKSKKAEAAQNRADATESNSDSGLPTL